MGPSFINVNFNIYSAFCVLCLVLFHSFCVNGFNLDSFNYAVFGGPRESMFGFTVAVHKHHRSWVLVGAPRATSQYQPDEVLDGGAVFKCNPYQDDQCEEIPFDQKGSHRMWDRAVDQKAGQWFGATLSASGSTKGGPVVACAPRYLWFGKSVNLRDPVGTCFVADSYFENFEEYSPCRTSNSGYHRQGSCQAGFSAAINTIGDRVFIGAPGSYYWQGQMYSVDAHASFNYTPTLLGTTYGAKGSVHQQSLETRPAVFHTREGEEKDDDSYMGYSTIAADFLGDGEQGIAAGMPRGASLQGKVLLFTWNLTNYKNITGNQMGSYFGYSLAAADVDGDKKLDLIVGAPLHTEPNTEGKYDVGRVYVFYQAGGHTSFNKSSVLDGVNSKSRFGHSLANLGDLNQDGFDDFAVGAPYDGPFNHGAVYIYYGSAQGVIEKYGQVIYAEDMQTINGYIVETFGFSVTGGLDLDDNEYPDMAVGAYLANTAFFFRARPVIQTEAFVRFQTPNKQIDIKKENCILSNGKSATCTNVQFCIKYRGKGVPENIQLNAQYILDTKKPNLPRMAFTETNSHIYNSTIKLAKGSRENCVTKEVYIKKDIRDKLTNFEAEFNYSMVGENQEASYYARTRDARSRLTPILDLNLHPSRKDSINIQNNCGSDNICIPDLRISVTKNVEKYLMGSKTNLEFDVVVSNFGEDSFETTFNITYPTGVYYQKTETKDGTQGITCSSRHNQTVTCDIGNPLTTGKIAKFRMFFTPSNKEGMSPTYEFEMTVNSSNPEKPGTMRDNIKKVTIDIWVDSALDVSGTSIPKDVYRQNNSEYNSSEIMKETDLGPQVIHLYTLKNKGPATIRGAEMYIMWPWQTLAGEDLLYLVDPPHVPPFVKCDMVNPNYKHYKLEYYAKSIWKGLQIDPTNVMKYDTAQPGIEEGTSVEGVTGGSEVHESVFNATTINGAGSEGGVGTTIERKLVSVIINGESEWKWVNDKTITDSRGNIIERYITDADTGASIDLGLIRNLDSDLRTETTAKYVVTYVNGKPERKWTNQTIIQDMHGNIIDSFTSEGIADSNIANKFIGTIGAGVNAETTAKYVQILVNGRPEWKWMNETIIRDAQGNIIDKFVNEGVSNGQINSKIGGARGGVKVATTSKYITTTVNGKTQGKWINETVITDESGNIIDRQVTEDVAAFNPLSANSGFHTSKHVNTIESNSNQEREENAYTLGGGANEGGSRIVEESIHRDGGSSSGSNQPPHQIPGKIFEEQNIEERRRQEERRRYELRLEEEERRRKEEAENEAQREKEKKEEERMYQERLLQYQRQQEERRRQEEEHRLEEQRRQGGSGSVTTNDRNSEEERLRQEEERRQDEYRRAQQKYEEDQRKYQEELQRRRQEDEKRRIQVEEARRREEERSRQWGQYGNQGNNYQLGQGGKSQGGRVQTGYFDEQGNYHNTRGEAQNRGSLNRTWSSTGNQNEGRGIYNQQQSSGGQLDLGQVSGGGGFQTHTLDLGTFNGGSGGSGGNSGAHQASGSRQWSSSGGRTREHSYSGTLEGGITDQSSRQSEWQGGNWNDQDDKPTEHPDYRRRRSKRQAELDPEIAENLKCTATKCLVMKCTVGVLNANDFISIALRSRLNVRAVRQLTKTQPIMLSSMMVARISELPYIGKPKEQPLYSKEVFTHIPADEQELVPQVVPLWIILLSAIAGTLILLLVILLLYKCGFFKRKRPTSAPERQPLRSNGYHPGDEAL